MSVSVWIYLPSHAAYVAELLGEQVVTCYTKFGTHKCASYTADASLIPKIYTELHEGQDLFIMTDRETADAIGNFPQVIFEQKVLYLINSLRAQGYMQIDFLRSSHIDNIERLVSIDKLLNMVRKNYENLFAFIPLRDGSTAAVSLGQYFPSIPLVCGYPIISLDAALSLA